MNIACPHNFCHASPFPPIFLQRKFKLSSQRKGSPLSHQSRVVISTYYYHTLFPHISPFSRTRGYRRKIVFAILSLLFFARYGAFIVSYETQKKKTSTTTRERRQEQKRNSLPPVDRGGVKAKPSYNERQCQRMCVLIIIYIFSWSEDSDL